MTEKELRPLLKPAWTRITNALNLHRWKVDFFFREEDADPGVNMPTAAMDVRTGNYGDCIAQINIYHPNIHTARSFRSSLLHEALHLVTEPYDRAKNIIKRSAGDTHQLLIHETFREFDEECVKHLEKALARLIFPEDYS